MKRILSMIRALCVVTLLLVSGCTEQSEAALEDAPPSPAGSIDTRLSDQLASGKDLDHGSVNIVKTGRVFSVSLEENQSIPYRWKADISDNSIAQLIYDEIVRDGITENKPGADGETHVFYFEAMRAGECSIEMNWADVRDDSIAQTVSYTILIED